MTDPAQPTKIDLGKNVGAKIALGVSGGIAAYKSAELVRLLTERGYRVQVVMTASAQEFIRPLTFAALTGEKVITGLFADTSGDATLQSAIEHIGVAQEVDLLLVAPATANILAKFANGVSDDFLTTMHLAYQGPIVVAPAMNTNMWDHPATGSVRQKTHRVKGLLGRSGGNQNGFGFQVSRSAKLIVDGGNNRIEIGEASRAHHAASEGA